MNYETKQEWIEAVMADTTLTPAAKVYAYGIFQHMYGKKDVAWPGAKGLAKTTGLNDSQFYKYNKALKAAGYLEVTSRKGTSNHYQLTLPTSSEGMYLPSVEVTLPSVEVPPTSSEGTKTTKNTTTESIKSKTPKSASAPVVLFEEEDIPSSILSLNPTFEEIVSPLLEDARFSLTETGDAAPELNKHTVAEINEQVPALAEEENWTADFAKQVLTLALDPHFAPETVTTGRRIYQAKQQVREAEGVDAW